MGRRMRCWRTLGLLLLLLGLWINAGCGGPPPTPTPSFYGTVLEPPLPAADFTLTDQHGESFRLGEQQGQIVLLFFGYASCPDVCPTTLGVWRQVRNQLGEDAERVRFVFITVDPARDTPAVLREHLAIFDSDFVGLSGTLEELEPVYEAYGVFREETEAPDSELAYLVTHTSSGYVIDSQGRWRLRHHFGTPADQIAADIRLLLEDQ